MGEIGNPQERSLCWLAAVIECEGTISVQTYTLPDGRIRLTPFVCFVNTDQALLAEVGKLFDQIGVKWRKCSHKGGNIPCFTYRVDGLEPVYTLLTAILPYIIGSKRKSAENVLAFLKSRKVRGIRRNEMGHIRRAEYSREEIRLITEQRTHKRAKSSETLCQAPNVIG